jgi:hypothetical protein
MCRELKCLVSIVLVLFMAGNASAGLVGYWKFDEGAGTVAADSSGQGNNGTLNGNTRWVTGQLGGALDFDGNGDFVEVPHASSLSLTDAITIAAWTNMRANSSGEMAIVSKGGWAANDLPYELTETRGDVIFWQFYNDQGRDGCSPNSPAANEWHHIAGTYDGQIFKCYIDGVFAEEWAYVGKMPQNTASVTIGKRSREAGTFFDGMIDEVAIFDRALSQDEIQIIMMGIGGFGPASGPTPPDGAIHPETWVSFSWRPGDFAVSHDVYLGENFDDVNAGTGGTFRGNQPTATFMAGFFGYPYPDGLVPGTTYYWRVDEVNQADPNSPWKGPVWSFTVPPKKAYNPNPPDGAKYVDTAVVLNWTAGLGARLHYVYFGDNFDTVNNATAGTPRGIATYTPTGPLTKGKTYYWRVDEFDAAATHKGDVWSFTTLADIAITNPDLVGWWKFDEGYGKKAIDFSGHGNDGTLGGDPRWVEGVMDGALDLSGDYVVIDGVDNDITGTNMTLSAWIKTTQSGEGEVFALNDSSSGYALLFGVQGGNVYRWDTADEQFPPAINDDQWHMITYVRNGSTAYIYVDGVQRVAQSTTFTLDSITRWSIGQEWDDSTPSDFYTGLVDDARIYNKALTADEVKQLMRGDLLRAWSPSPNNRSTVDIERARQALTWSAGDKASQHDVYFGLDKDAVGNASATDTTGIYRGRQSARSYSPTEALAWGTGPYYWRIDEVNTDGTITQGGTWNFSVANYLVVDDIESYNDLAETDPASNRIYKKWIDGYGTTTNGALVGNLDVPLTERGNVHSGGQAMPLSYDNNRKFSEATLTLAAGRDWTREGVANLSLWFRGATTNAAEKMYVVLNGTAVVYSNDTSLTQKTAWTEWVIPLQQFAGLGVNLTNVTSITIGFGTRGNTTVAGGTGQMYIDDIRLYRP